MATCKWQPTDNESRVFEDGYECREAPWKGGNVCIFHAPRDRKTKEEFEEAIRDKIEREESDKKVDSHDFRGYVFPDGFSAFAYMPRRGGKEFRKRVDFTCAKFGDEANFEDATFGDEANFFAATFGSEASFAGATFGDEASFACATFGDKAFFAGTTFGDEAIFSHAIFQENVRFSGEDKDESGGCVFEGSVDFRHVHFHKPETVLFYKVNLSQALVSDVFDLDKVSFWDVRWGAEPKRFDVLKNFFRRLGKGNLREARELYLREHAACGRGLSLYEEFSLESNAALVAEAYRSLQKNYENKRYYRLSDDFYAGAMEMHRLQRRSMWRRWPYTLYRSISLYGQSWWRPLRLALGTLMLATLVFWWTGFTAHDNTKVLSFADHSTMESVLSALGDAALHSFSAVTFQRMRYAQGSDSRLFYVATYLETIFVPVLVAFFLLALKRRFRR